MAKNTAEVAMNVGEDRRHETLPTEWVEKVAAQAVPGAENYFGVDYNQVRGPGTDPRIILVPSEEIVEVRRRFMNELGARDIDSSDPDKPKMTGEVIRTMKKGPGGEDIYIYFVDAGSREEVEDFETGQDALDGRKVGALIGGIVHAAGKNGELFNEKASVYIPKSLLGRDEFLAGIGEGVGNMAYVPTGKQHVRKGDKVKLAAGETYDGDKPETARLEHQDGSATIITKMAEVRKGLGDIGIYSDADAQAEDISGAINALALGERRASDKVMTRFMGELPREALTPEVTVRVMMNFVAQLRETYGLTKHQLDIEVYGLHDQGSTLDDKLKGSIRDIGEGMGWMEAVHAGSELPGPYFVRVKYRGNPDSNRLAVGAGKHLNFDDGGDQHKQKHSFGMEKDMLGAWSIMSTLLHLCRTGSTANVDIVAGVAENILGTKAQRAGNMPQNCIGKIIKIKDTDAEGRLVVGDALAGALLIAEEEGMVTDDEEKAFCGTLTGNAVSAHGGSETVICRDKKKAARIAEASTRAGVPAEDDHIKMSDYKTTEGNSDADMINLAPGASPIPRGRHNGAAVVQEGAGISRKERGNVTHLDIAADCAFVGNDKAPDLGKATSPSGEGVTTAMEWVKVAEEIQAKNVKREADIEDLMENGPGVV